MTNKEKLIALKEEMLNTMIAIANEENDDEAKAEFMRTLENSVEETARDASDFHFTFNKFWDLYE